MKHLGSLESTQEARVDWAFSNFYSSFVLSKLPTCFISLWTCNTCWLMNQLLNYSCRKKANLSRFLCKIPIPQRHSSSLEETHTAECNTFCLFSKTKSSKLTNILQKSTQWSQSTSVSNCHSLPNTLTSVCICSIWLPMHFLRCWHGENV